MFNRGFDKAVWIVMAINATISITILVFLGWAIVKTLQHFGVV